MAVVDLRISNESKYSFTNYSTSKLSMLQELRINRKANPYFYDFEMNQRIEF